MAPHDLDTSKPADDSIVSAFPAEQRGQHAQIENMFTTEHEEASGRHKFVTGNEAARDAISDWPNGSIHLNEANGVLSVRVAGAWVELGVQTVGDIKFAAYTTIPEGWVACDGATYDGTAASYAALFAKIGVTFGGSGTDFKVPDLGGIFVAGFKSGSADYDPVGNPAIGTEKHMLVQAELPNVNLTSDDPGTHVHTGVRRTSSDGGGPGAIAATSPPNTSSIETDAAGAHTHTVPLGGSDTAHENRPPFCVLGHLIKL